MIFSMPAGAPPQKLLTAVRALARQEFDGLHRYALAVHTDEPRPHVHMVIRAPRDNELVRYAAVGGPNHVVSASASPS